MATYCGLYGEVTYNGSVVAEVTDFTYDESINLIETTSMGDSGRTYHGCLKDGTANVNAFHDPTDGGHIALVPGNSYVLVLKVATDDDGATYDLILSGTATCESYSIQTATESMVTANYTLRGVLAKGTIT